LVPASANNLASYSQAITQQQRTEVQALLFLLENLPGEFVDLPFQDYLEFTRCRASLATALARWTVGDGIPARDVGGKDPIERLRRLLKQCHDELPPPEPELPFIDDIDTRLGIEDQIHAAWTNFDAREWMGATVFAGAALEAVLLWAVKETPAASGRSKESRKDSKSLHAMRLNDLIDEATELSLISPDSAKQAHLARDARNLVHPGRVARSGRSCSKATALTGLAGLYRVVDDLKRLGERNAARML
jgi:hypothetical protein